MLQLTMAGCLSAAGGAELPTGATARVAGVAMLSFVPLTRERFDTLQPPDDAAYLSNTAVDAAFRRWGLAAACSAAWCTVAVAPSCNKMRAQEYHWAMW
jgi:ribosomal protein S18 acetylase RimI-like enzyme